MYENSDLPTSSPARSAYQYETFATPSRTLYENSVRPTTFTSCESIPPTIDNEISLTPPFQKKLPSIPVAILGLVEVLSGIAVLVLEVLVFDIAVGVWCGCIYMLAGIATIFLVIGTDRERHHTTAVLIFQFVALMFSITEICLHADFYQKRCWTTSTEPSRDTSHPCQILLGQIGVATVVLAQTIIYAVIYCRTTVIVLKQPHGTFNFSNALNFTC